MKNKAKLSIMLGLLAASLAFGQDGGPRPPGGMGMGGPFGGPGMGGFGLGAKVVTGAPYSADVSSQAVQSLPDGNTISRNTTGHVSRDSQGRTYNQETMTGGFMGSTSPMTVTFINDPVAGYSYVLNSSTKVATRIAKRTHSPSGTGATRPEGPPGMGGRMHGDSVDAQKTDLGTQTIGGVSAQGTSITHTVPAGAMGNSQPIVSTGETWFSPDLQVIVLAKHSDPRMGQSTYSLVNIQRTEPAASLFQVPSDYTVQDGKAGGPGPGMGFGGHRPPQE